MGGRKSATAGMDGSTGMETVVGWPSAGLGTAAARVWNGHDPGEAAVRGAKPICGRAPEQAPMRRVAAAMAVVVLCGALAAGVAGAAHEEPSRTVLGLELTADGHATVHYVTSFDLSDPDERATFEDYADNETRRARFREAAVAELRSASETANENTEYEMTVRDPSVRTYEEGGYGRVEVLAAWHGLAYYDDRRVIVAQPFRSGYRPDRNVAIHGPDGYRRNRTAPQPIRARRNGVLIDTPTSDFSNFFVEFVDPDAPTETPTPTATATATPAPGDDGRGGGGRVLRALVIALVPAGLFVLAVRRD